MTTSARNRSALLVIALSLTAFVQAAWSAERQLKYDTYTSLEALEGQTMRRCLITSHDCEVCSIDDTQKLVCSSVGTACEPKEWRCMYLSGE